VDYERLWAPWRLEYVTGDEKSRRDAAGKPQSLLPGADEDCFLCRDVAQYDEPAAADRAHRVVHHGTHTVTVLNFYPYNNGHLLIAPRGHKGRLDELTDAEHLEIQRMITATSDVIRQGMHADGFNIGVNLGRTAGAGLPDHVHWHVVPRWQGDGNFMPTLAGVRVIPQSLDALWEWLSQELSARV